MLNYKVQAENKSLYNTPPPSAIYILGLTMKWLKALGGLHAIAAVNERKAAKLYAEIDRTGFYRGTAQKDSRSLMNVTFRLPSEELEKQVRQGGDGRRPRRPQGPPLGRRDARVDLQRVPGGGRRRARRVHARIRAQERLAVKYEPRRHRDTEWSPSSPCLRASVARSPFNRSWRNVYAGVSGGAGEAATLPPVLPRRFRAASTNRASARALRRLPVNLEPGQRLAERAPCVSARLPAAKGPCRAAAAAVRVSGVAVRCRAGPAAAARAEIRGSFLRSSIGDGCRRQRSERVAEREQEGTQQNRVGQGVRGWCRTAADTRPPRASDSQRASLLPRWSSGRIGSSNRRSASIRNAFAAAPDRSIL